MPQPELDPAFTAYVRDEPTITYAQPGDPWLTRQVISTVERLFGRKRIETIYRELKAEPFEVERFFSAAFQATGISCRYNAAKLKEIPADGPLVFVANHPFGIVDGMALCDMALKTRGNFRILINSLLCQDEISAVFPAGGFPPDESGDEKQYPHKESRPRVFGGEHSCFDFSIGLCFNG